MPGIDFQPEADAVDFLPEDAPVAPSQPRGSLSQASAEFEAVTRPQSPIRPPVTRPTLDMGSAPRSIAEGLQTEQEERRAGAPLVVNPQDKVRLGTRPTQRLATPGFAPIDTSQSPNAPFTPEEMAERTRQKQADQVATSSIPRNYQTLLETGRRAGTAVGENVAAWATPSPKPGGYGLITNRNRGEFEAAHPAVAGVSRAAGGFAGQMAADPVTYLFAGSSELASPILDRIISTGFRIGLGVGAVRAARDLQKNWNIYTPAQRYEVATEAGLSGVLAVGAKQIREHLGSPYEALPTQPTARAESLFRNLVYKAGGTVPENPTLQEAAAAFRAAMNNLHPDVNPSTAEDATNLSSAWATLKTSGRFGAAPPTPQPTRLELAHYLDRAGHNPDVAGALYESDHAARIAPSTEAGQPERMLERPHSQAPEPAAISVQRTPEVITARNAPPIDFQPEIVKQPGAAVPTRTTGAIPPELKAIQEKTQAKGTAEVSPTLASWEPPHTLGAFPERPDIGAKARGKEVPRNAKVLGQAEALTGKPPEGQEERRKVDRSAQQAEDKLFKQARTELGEDATTDQVMARVEELRPKGVSNVQVPGESLTGAKLAGEASKSVPSAAEVSRQKLGLPPAPGKVGEMNVSDLKVAPGKFQYKLSTDSEGVGPLLKETKVFNPDLAGIISVWRDPADGKTYVVNGHHRYELAQRTGQRGVTVRHIAAKDATEARAIGALQNIAEGRGTAVDAAKFFRDTGLTPENLKSKGISLGEATARDGVAMSRLEPGIFGRVLSGDLRQGRAKAIGDATPDHAEQKAILSLVEKKESRGGKVSDDTLSELIRLVKGSEKTTETTANLFGAQEITRSLALEKAEISAYIRQQLANDKKLFGFVAKENRAQELARAGNKINVEQSGRISSEAAQAEEVYNKLSERGGPISSILDQSARRLADGENAATVKSDAYQKVRAQVSQTLAGSEGTRAQRSAGAPETSKADHPNNSVGLPPLNEARVLAPTEAGLRRGKSPMVDLEEEPTLPGMENVPGERAAAAAEQQGRNLTDKLVEPAKSIERKAGEIEQKSPLFRDTEANPQREMFGNERGFATPAAINPFELVKAAKAVYSDFISRVIDENLDLGEKYRRVAEHDPQIAKFLHDKDNASRYYRDKAQSNVDQVVKGLDESQIRLTAMMADSDAREFLQDAHPDQYDEARNDPAVMAGVRRFQKYQQELAALRIALGWHVRRDLSTFEDEDGNWQVLDRNGKPVLAMGGKLGRPEIFKSQKEAQDYVEQHGKILDHLKRTYPEHLREPLMGRTDAGPNVAGYSGQGIRPPKPDKKQRLATAEYFWDHGAKDFSGYLQSYAQARHATLNKAVFDAITDEGTQWKAGTAQPKQIVYRGKTYYCPDVAASMRSGGMKNVPEFKAYDPSRDDKLLIKSFEDGWGTLSSGRPGISVHDRWLAPKQVVDAIDNYDVSRGYEEHDSIRRFFQEQIVGLFGPTVHMLNMMRRLAHTVGSGAWDPRVWPYYQKLLFSSELRERMAQGLADDAIDALSKHGTYTNARDIGSLHDYALGNMDPRNWARWTVGKFSKGILFDPKFLGGFGGVDQKARVLAYDFLHEKAGMGEEEAAKNVDDGFGRYNRASWTERMKRWARVLLFPGWDFSSLTWFLRHPIKTAVLPSLVTLGANLALNKAGKNKDQDKYDYGYLHYGDRKFRTSLLTESMALHIAEPLLEAGKAALEGGSARDIGTAAGEGAIRGAGGLAGALRPDIQVAISLLSNRQYPGGTKEITKPEDKNLPGRVLPNRKLDKLAVFALVKAFPAVNRFLDSSYDNIDWRTGVGSVVGVVNYRSGAEERLRANAAKAMGYSQTLSSLNVTNEAAAERFMADPNKAAYLVFNGDLSQLEKDLKGIDAQISRVKMAGGLSQRDRKEGLKELEDARTQILNSADALNDQLSAVKLRMKNH